MPRVKFRHGCILGVFGGLGLVRAGCADQPQPAHRGTYTAARHRMTGSNIPQPDSVTTVNNTYDTSPSAGTGANMSGSNQAVAGFGTTR